MKHLQIATTLGWTEEPSTEEGLFLQPEEATTIENVLATLANTTAAQVALEQTIVENAATIDAMTVAATVATEAATVQATRITELEGIVAKLNGKSSGAKGSTIPGAVDEPPKEATVITGLPRFDDPNHPANLAAARIGRGIKA